MRGEHLKPGEDHPRAKLSNRSVADIRAAYKEGQKQIVLAMEYGVSQAAISKIVNGHTWNIGEER